MRIKRSSNGSESTLSQQTRATTQRKGTHTPLTRAKTSMVSVRQTVQRNLKRHMYTLAPFGVASIMLLMVVFGTANTPDESQAVTRVGGLGGVSALDEVSAADVAARIAAGADLI